MSVSGPGFAPNAQLSIAVPFHTLLRAVQLLARGDEEQRTISDELQLCIPLVLLINAPAAPRASQVRARRAEP